MTKRDYKEKQEEFRKKHGFYIKDFMKYIIVLFITLLTINILAEKISDILLHITFFLSFVLIALSFRLLRYLKRKGIM